MNLQISFILLSGVYILIDTVDEFFNFSQTSCMDARIIMHIAA